MNIRLPSNPSSAPEFLAIGHICHDRLSERMIPGGAALYAGITAKKLLPDSEVAVLTSFGPDFRFGHLLEENSLVSAVVPAQETTVFENIYQAKSGHRDQLLHGLALPLTPDAMPPFFQQSKIVLLCPIAQEVSLDLIPLFSQALIGICPQGYMRRWEHQKRGRVEPMLWQGVPAKLRPHVTVISLSEEDVKPFPNLISQLVDEVPILLVTHGKRGATVIHNGQSLDLPAFPANEVDPTGAGDVFMAAFLVAYAECRDPVYATIFAQSAASFAIEATGITGLPSRDQVLERMTPLASALF